MHAREPGCPAAGGQRGAGGGHMERGVKVDGRSGLTVHRELGTTLSRLNPLLKDPERTHSHTQTLTLTHSHSCN